MKFWKWKCLNDKCNHEFVIPKARLLQLVCRRCHQDDKGFLKIKEQEGKYN